LVALHAVFSSSTENELLKLCNSKKSKNIKFRSYPDIIAFFKVFNKDPNYLVKLVQALPKELADRYYKERNE
jgi:hypothetical protein